MSNYYTSSSNSGSGAGAAVVIFIIIPLIIAGIVGIFSDSSSSSSSSKSSSSYGSYSSYDYDDYDYPEPDYDYDYDYDYEDYYDDEPDVETWDCTDATSYDKNPYNDNYCVSSYGKEIYTTDSNAESLDPYYSAGKSGHSYYNSF